MSKLVINQARIAEELGVSQRTVSAALGNSGRVSEARRKQVLGLAAKLGYRLNTAARAQRTRRFDAAGLVLSTDEGRSYLPQGLFGGIHDALLEQGMHLAVARLPDTDLVKVNAMPRILEQWCCDGLLINYTDRLPRGFEKHVAAQNVPCVWMNRKRETQAVYYDDYRGGYEATRHLLAMRHERVLYLDFVDAASGEDLHYSRADRRSGYIAAMREAGLSPWFGDGLVGTPIEARHKVLASLLRRPDRPTAILSYDAGHRVLYAAALAGLTVPEDLSVMSFGELHGSVAQIARGERHLGPDLTYMGLPTDRLGRRAVSQLLTGIGNEAGPRESEVIPLELVAGETAAAAPRSIRIAKN